MLSKIYSPSCRRPGSCPTLRSVRSLEEGSGWTTFFPDSDWPPPILQTSILWFHHPQTFRLWSLVCQGGCECAHRPRKGPQNWILLRPPLAWRWQPGLAYTQQAFEPTVLRQQVLKIAVTSCRDMGWPRGGWSGGRLGGDTHPSPGLLVCSCVRLGVDGDPPSPTLTELVADHMEWVGPVPFSQGNEKKPLVLSSGNVMCSADVILNFLGATSKI
jgi:hypothetical protein